jgi:hypothetical protein
MDLASLYKNITELSIPIGGGIGCFIATIWSQRQAEKKNFNNGNGLTIRQALDEMGKNLSGFREEFSGFREEVRGELRDVRGEVRDVKGRMTDVEQAQTSSK